MAAGRGAMGEHSALCAVAEYYHVEVPRPVALCADWQTRVTGGAGFRHPRGWRWDVKLLERAKALHRSPELSLWGCNADIPYARSFGELRWARAFVRGTISEQWCLGLALFDGRAIADLSFVYKRLGGDAGVQDRRLRRDERRWRHDWQVMMTGAQVEGDVLTSKAITADRYPKVPRCWDEYEVPWGLLPECPRAALLWGLELARSPFRAADTACERGGVAHAPWAAVMSQWAQNVAGELSAEAEAACNGGEAGDVGRLWWIPPALLRGMKDIGEQALCGGNLELADRLKALLSAIPAVRWSLVDPCWVRRPRENWYRAPVFLRGDFVPWDPASWSLDLRREMLVPLDRHGRLLGADDRGPRLEALLCLYRREGDGMAVSPVE